MIGLAVCAFAPAVTAHHWDVGVTYGPTTVFMDTDEQFAITLTNNGPDPVAVTKVDLTFDWVTSGFRYTVTSQPFNLAPANAQRLTTTIHVPRLVSGSVHSLSVFVTAQTNGDLIAEEKQYTGHVTATESLPPEAVFGGLVLCGAGILVAVIVLVLIIFLVVRRRAPPPLVMPPMAPFSQFQPPAAGPAHLCPTCGRPLAFISQYQRWYCQAENRYV